MRTIVSVVAAAVTDPTALGRGDPDAAGWHDEIDHMNPLISDPRYTGQANRFAPPWGETICVVTASDGTWGLGLTSLSTLTVALINEYLAPMLEGDDPADVERIWDMMATACGAHFGVSGVASYAISAVDLALWDLRGKHLEQPVHRLIEHPDLTRQSERQPVRCYATGLDVGAYAELGFTAFKLACPWGPDAAQAIDRTKDLIDHARVIVGDDAELMLDCWGVHHVSDAVLIGEAFADRGLGWIEDFIFPEDWTGYRQVRDLLPQSRLAAGERWYTDRPFAQAIAEGWVDVVQPDALWLGGATPTIRVAQLAADTGVDLSIHCGGNDSFGQHLSYGLEGNLWAEIYIGAARGESLLDSYRSTPGMSLPIDGHLTPSDAPGFGIELTLADIERATR